MLYRSVNFHIHKHIYTIDSRWCYYLRSSFSLLDILFCIFFLLIVCCDAWSMRGVGVLYVCSHACLVWFGVLTWCNYKVQVMQMRCPPCTLEYFENNALSTAMCKYYRHLSDLMMKDIFAKAPLRRSHY